jgi:hypothetical protein
VRSKNKVIGELKMGKLLLCLCLFIITICSSGAIVYGQCRVIRQGTFRPQNKRVRLVTRQTDPAGTHKVIVFQTSLRVNTDGAPNSYHPEDLTGSRIAINNICNGVSVTRNGVRVGCQRARQIFEQFHNNNFRPVAGHRISWQNVIAATTDNAGRTIPCIFRSGEFEGYFGSLTTLKNGLSGEAGGECGRLNQLDQRVIPAFVLPGGQNIVTTFGAAIGDLLIAFNPRNNVITAAVVGDIGPANKLGEGSVGLNMTLLGRMEQPKTYREALRLDTGTHEMSIVIIPNSRTFNLSRPFTKENLSDRVQEWLTRAGFETQRSFVDFLRTCNN